MDNITHSLFGLAVAELASPPPELRRRVWLGTAMVAANLPDIDLAYTWITPGPLGYLLHHRGYTHTLAGLAVFAAGFAILRYLWPAARALPAAAWRALALLVGVNLVAHLALDGFNSYGVHPFFPFGSRWYYGDAVFIFEPWIWIALGTAGILNAERAWQRLSIGGAIAGLMAVVVVTRVLLPGAVLTMAVAAALATALMRPWTRRARAAAALAATAGFMVGMLGLSQVVTARALAAAGGGQAVDVIKTPDPGMPVCWFILVLSRDAGGDDLRTVAGTLSLAPAWVPASSCASDRLERAAGTDPRGRDAVAWRDDLHASIARLRTLADSDCAAAAWLRFGRAPAIRRDAILDLRFDSDVRGNFSALRLGSGSGGCPPFVPPWTAPRRDLLDGPR
ncbi:MAG: metal-dependent hydrolase [Acidobacteriota bacterium]